MVQLKRDLPRPRNGKADNTYWAVGDDARDVELKELEFQKKKESRSRKRKRVDLISEPATARIATDLANRKERGLLNYEDCSVAELEAFVGNRHLNLPSEDSYRIPDLPSSISLRDMRRRQLQRQERANELDAMRIQAKEAAYIAVLHQADDTAVFHQFPSLPPELRANVYKKYFDSLLTLPAFPHQPPLTLVSRSLRADALPLFYEQSTFLLRLHIMTPMMFLGHTATSRVSLRDDLGTDLLTSPNLPVTALSRISHMCLRLSHCLIDITLSGRFTQFDEEDKNWVINLNAKDGSVMTGNESLDKPDANKQFRTNRRARLEAAILRVLQNVAARPKAHRLQRGDLEVLREAVQAALNQPE